ncbi:integrin alpha-PS5 [Cephus cinctus]|uniref:Integrin alpha-PS5 n=1 Tax=Cephus cinctus TaxID=211228 RepID=A0AAJ7CFJ8_CEPCN|nr:integrin alpha-PS5 [Cephus cinctus]
MYLSCGNWWFGLWLIILPISTLGYNLDVHSAIIYADPSKSVENRSSYFGFSVALYPRTTYDSKAVILIGAPRGNSSGALSVTEPGVVYRCFVEGDCKEWVLDVSKNGKLNNIIQNKDNAWIGASIAVKNTTSPKVVVCAPNWKSQSSYMNGMCFWSIAQNDTAFNTLAKHSIKAFSSTSDQIEDKAFKYGMAQGGFSLHIISDDFPWDIMFGAPGTYIWKGTAVLSTGSKYIIPDSRIVNGGETIYNYFFGYTGYAVTSGQYFRKGERLYVASAPRKRTINGMVLVFKFAEKSNRKLLIKTIVHGEQHGEYFGASLTSCDVNGDGKDDLIVGAPFWSKNMEEGRVYVLFSKYNDHFNKQIVNGKVTGARFGTTVICLGDLDYDGYGDVAIAAPYEDGYGAVYIHNGDKDGLSKKHSQRISGAQFAGGLRGFGISISEPRDIDNNGYSDVAIGAYLSNRAVLLRSRPVVIVKVTLKLSQETKLQRNSTSFSLKFCCEIYGAHINNSLPIITILKVDEIHGRARHVQEGTNGTDIQPQSLSLNKKHCNILRIDLNKNIYNFIDPVDISASVKLQSDQDLEEMMSQDPNLTNYTFCRTCPVINKALSKTEAFVQLPFAVECGDDNVCNADLSIAMSTDLNSDNTYVIGSRKTFQLIVHIHNNGEPAYRTLAVIYIPEPLLLSSIPTECTESNTGANNTLQIFCYIENPFRNNKTLIIDLETGDLVDMGKVEVQSMVSTQSEESNPEDNNYTLTIFFDIDVDIAIVGKAQEVSYSYFHEKDEKQLESITFQHIYEIQKFGASPIMDAEVTISVPIMWSDDNGQVEVISINNTIGYKDGHKIHCSSSSSLLENGMSMIDLPVASAILHTSKFHNADFSSSEFNNKNRMSEPFSINENITLNVPAANRTLYINCTSPSVTCTDFTCSLGTFKDLLSQAKILLTMNLQLLNFKTSMTEGKDIIFVVSKGYVTITQPEGIIQSQPSKPDTALVGTTFVGSPVADRIAVWIIIVSVLLGALLLILLTLALIKIGFFNRKKKDELEALKAQTDTSYGIILETTSSREVLDQD